MPRFSDPIDTQQYNIAWNRSSGPLFGRVDEWPWRFDLEIVENANKSRNSCSHLGGCLTGTPEFLVADFEVFEFF